MLRLGSCSGVVAGADTPVAGADVEGPSSDVCLVGGPAVDVCDGCIGNSACFVFNATYSALSVSINLLYKLRSKATTS